MVPVLNQIHKHVAATLLPCRKRVGLGNLSFQHNLAFRTFVENCLNFFNKKDNKIHILAFVENQVEAEVHQ